MSKNTKIAIALAIANIVTIALCASLFYLTFIKQ